MSKKNNYFVLIDYFDVWGNEEDGWEVNNQAVVEENIYIDPDTTPRELFLYLRDALGYFQSTVKFNDVQIDWFEPSFIEIYQASDGMPLCCLRSY